MGGIGIKKGQNKHVSLSGLSALERNRRKFGTWLHARRKEISRSLKTAAVEAGCSDAWLCQLENARCDATSITVASLPKLARAYELPITTILSAVLRAGGYREPIA